MVPLLLRCEHLLRSGPAGLGDLCLRGFLGGYGRLLGFLGGDGRLLCGGGRGERRRQPCTGLNRRAARLLGVSLGLLAALPGSAAMSSRMPQRSHWAARILRPGHAAALPGQLLAPLERRQGGVRLPAHRVLQAAVRRFRSRLHLLRQRLVIAAGIRACDGFRCCFGHWRAPFRYHPKAKCTTAKPHPPTRPGRDVPKPVRPWHPCPDRRPGRAGARDGVRARVRQRIGEASAPAERRHAVAAGPGRATPG